MDNIYDLRIGERQISIPIAIASMAGMTDGAYVRDRAGHPLGLVSDDCLVVDRED